MIRLNLGKGVFNEVYKRHLNNKHRYQIYFGGSSSGKSFFIAQRVVLDVLSGRNYLVVRNTANTIRRSCWNEIVKAIARFGVRRYFEINKTDMTITCSLNSSQILFAGLDDPEKIKSITPVDGVITDIWVEEATECEIAAVKQMDKRLRGRSRFTKRMTISFNPILQDHWLYKWFFDIWRDDGNYFESDLVSILKTTYKDNEFLELDDILALENEADEYYYNVYTLGNWGVLGNVIFKNWRVEDFEPDNFDSYLNGIDWGFAGDPFAFIRCRYDKTRHRLYLCDEIYACELSNGESSQLVKAIIGDEVVYCDSEEPKSLADYRAFGVRAVKADKPKGSIAWGIRFLQSLEIIIHPRCQNARNEIQKYKWKEDRLGNVLPIPIGRDDHLIDALRYALTPIRPERSRDEAMDGKPDKFDPFKTRGVDRSDFNLW